MEQKPLTNIEIGHKNRIEALMLIWRFRWLRPLELGQLMWLTSNNPQQQGAALVKKLQTRKLVALKKLPDGGGTAAVLSERGARLLRDEVIGQNMTIDTKSQKWGETVEGKFVPNLQWKHDLLAHSLLILLKRQGAKNVYSETEILRRYPLSNLKGKAPDGLFSLNGNHYWLEQERREKQGKALEELIFEIERVAGGKSQQFFDIKPHRMAIAIPPNEYNRRGNLIDHRKIIEAKIQKTIDGMVRVYFFHLQMKGHAVIGFNIEEAKIFSNAELQKIEHQARERRRLDKMQNEEEWKIFQGVEHLGILGSVISIEVWESNEEWNWRIYEQLHDERGAPLKKIEYKAGASTSKSECKAQALKAGKEIRDKQIRDEYENAPKDEAEGARK
jgi:hypothetical protein